ncbi:phage tail tape measure protein [Povalibacter sp.]|uniref:phage tail tape measure protein n=1 Tax=Povalibacter sp. TaxID=1962978 RepID=UPI002F4030A7
MSDLVTLGVRIDTADVGRGAAELDKFASSADKAKNSAAAIQPAIESSGRSLQQLSAGASASAQSQQAGARAGEQFVAALRSQSQAVERTADGMRAQRVAQDAAAAAALREAQAQAEAAAAKRSAEVAQQRFVAGLRDQIALQGKSQADVLRYRANQLGVAKEAETYIAQMERSAAATGQLGMSARQTAFAMRLLPMQVTDIVTSLASGQSPFLVAIQQGGQLRDSFGGFGNTLRALGTIITPVRIAMAATAGSLALIAKAFLDAQRESFELNKALIMSGNAAGVTSDALAGMADRIDDVVGTQREASAAIGALAATGRVAGKDLERFAAIALQLKRTAGESVEDTVKSFAELGRRPAEAATRLNERFNFLTVATYRQIKALEDQGRVFEAGEVAQQAYARAIEERTQDLEKHMGTLQRLARGTKAAFAEVGDALLSIGRPAALQDQIADAEQRIRQLQDLQRRFPQKAVGGLFTDRARELAQQQARLRGLRQETEAEQSAARAGAERRRALDAYVAGEKEAIAVGQARLAVMEAMARIDMDQDVGGIRRSLNASLGGYSAYAAQLEALRHADLVSERDYYAAKRALIDRDSDLRTSALRQERARVEAELKRLDQARADAGRGTKTESERIKAELPLQREIAQTRERIRDIDAEIAAIGAERGSQQSLLNIELQGTQKLSEQILASTRATAEAQLALVSRQRDRDLDAFGRGNRQREHGRGLDEIEDRFLQERRSLDERRSRGDFKDREGQYDELLAIATDYRDRDLADYEAYWTALGEKQGDFYVGAQEAMANYFDDARNVAKQSEELFSNAFRGMEDALVEFAMTGKSNFKDLARSIIADLLRIQIRAMAANALGGAGGWLGAIFGAMGGGGAIGGIGAGGGSPPLTMGGGFGGMPFADTGIKRVPRDNQPALLHRGEAVLPANLNPWAGGKSPFGGTTVNLHSVLNVGAGANVAQFQAALDQRDLRLKAEIAENLRRGRWAGVMS